MSISIEKQMQGTMRSDLRSNTDNGFKMRHEEASGDRSSAKSCSVARTVYQSLGMQSQAVDQMSPVFREKFACLEETLDRAIRLQEMN